MSLGCNVTSFIDDPITRFNILRDTDDSSAVLPSKFSLFVFTFEESDFFEHSVNISQMFYSPGLILINSNSNNNSSNNTTTAEVELRAEGAHVTQQKHLSTFVGTFENVRHPFKSTKCRQLVVGTSKQVQHWF